MHYNLHNCNHTICTYRAVPPSPPPGLPPPPDKDAYLLSRLERLYADLRDYRPGMCRADMDDAIRGERSGMPGG